MASPTIHSNTAPAAGGSATSDANTAVGDLVIVFTAERAGAGVPTFTLQSGFTEIRNQPHDDGSTDGRLAVACKVATSSGAQSYQAYTTSTGSPVWWTGLMVLDAGTFDPSLIFRANSVTTTGTGAPNPPACGVAATAPLALNDYLFTAVAFWHLTASQTLTPTAPSSYTLRGNVSGAATGDVAWATRAATAFSGAEDPAAWADNQTPNGSSGITFAVPAPFAFGKIRQLLYTSNFTSGSAAAFPQNVQAGSLLAACFSRETDSTPTVTDTQSNSWAVSRAHYDSGSDWRADIWSTKAGSTGACSVTVTATGTLRGNRIIAEYQGPFHATPLDAVNSANGESTAPSSGNATPSVNGCLFLGYIDAIFNTFTKGTGFTLDFSAAGTNVDSALESLIQGTAAAQDADGTLDASNFWIAIVATFKPPASGQTIAVGQVSETDTAQAVAWAPKRRLVGQVSEIDIAQPVAWAPKRRLVAQVQETDTAQPITVRRSFPVAQVEEVDTAQPIAWAPKHRSVNRVFETDTAQAVSAQRVYPVAQVEEVDTAQTITPVKGGQLIAVGQVEEMDTAQAIAHSKTKAIGQVEEVDTAQAITVSQAKIIAVAQVSEVDTAQAISWAPKHRLIGQVEEVDTAFTITPVLTGTIPAEVMVVIAGTPGATEARVLTEDLTKTKVVIESASKIVVIQDPAATPVQVII
jgi:hypothetical protein